MTARWISSTTGWIVSTGTLRGRAVIPNKDLSILPGQFGRVRLIGSFAL